MSLPGTETGTIPIAPIRSRRVAGPLIGMTCAMVGALALCCAGDYIFFMYPKMNQLWMMMKFDMPTSTQVSLAYGAWLWIVTAVGGVVSLGLALRRPGRASTVVFNVIMCVFAIGLTYLVKSGSVAPFINVIPE